MQRGLVDVGIYEGKLLEMPLSKLLISTINAHSFNTLQKDDEFVSALKKSTILLPDGISVVYAYRFLTGKKIGKIAGEDLFKWEMDRLNRTGGKVFFLGSTDETLKKIEAKAGEKYPNITTAFYSPPYKQEFSAEENDEMIRAVNSFTPDVLFIGMTAPKQEKWASEHFEMLDVKHVCSIGAVFDFYAGTVKRAPKWMIAIGMEWFYRLIREPRRMWRRYLIGNTLFIYYILREKFVG